MLFLSTQYKIECTFVITFSCIVSFGVNSVANLPEILSMKKLSFPCQIPRKTGFTLVGSTSKYGFSKLSVGRVFSASFINLFQIGPATAAPPFFIGLLSLLPAQTPTTIDGVYPMVQASLLLFVVPVFTATSFPGRYKTEWIPKVGSRAFSSDKTSEMVKAVLDRKSTRL